MGLENSRKIIKEGPIVDFLERKNNEGILSPDHILLKVEKFLRKLNLFPAKKNWQDIINSQKEAGVLFNNFESVLKQNELEFNKNMRVVEIGSGNAKFLEYLRIKGIKAVGVDINPRGRYKEAQVQARIESLPFGDESVDIVLANMVFDNKVYDHNQEEMMKEISRVLKKGGIFIAGQFSSIENEKENNNLSKQILPNNVRFMENVFIKS